MHACTLCHFSAHIKASCKVHAHAGVMKAGVYELEQIWITLCFIVRKSCHEQAVFTQRSSLRLLMMPRLLMQGFYAHNPMLALFDHGQQPAAAQLPQKLKLR